MAERVVDFLLKHLSQLLVNEAKLLCGVEDRVRSLHNELGLIKVYLRTFDGNKKSKTEMEQEVVNQITNVAHEAEDVIDTYIAKITIHKRRSMQARMLCGLDHAKLLHEVAEKIEHIKTTLNEIRDNKIKYNFEESTDDQSTSREEEERAQLVHKRRTNVEEEDVVGFVHDSKAVIKRLVEGGSRRNTVSIIGMGGLGKTTLARKVYKSNKVQGYFNCRAWIYVSNEFRAKELLLGLLKQLKPNPEYERRSNKKGKKHKEIDKPQDFSILSSDDEYPEHERRSNKKGKKHKKIDKPQDFSILSSDDEYPEYELRSNKKGKKHKKIDQPRDFSKLSTDELKITVRECLKGKRYLLVLDDMWKTQDWDEAEDAFPDENIGSKILITSRLKEVASHTSQDPPHYLQFLNDKDSWELFSKKVFRGEEYPSDLELLGKQIVESCGGLPLSIFVLAGLLANKEKSHREWAKVVGHVNWYLTRDETQVKDIVLKLSYDNLPTRLKICFLYLGTFPEDFEIPVRELLEKWVAEGFIQETGTRDPVDVAEDYLYELIDRSLVQVAQVKSSGGVKTSRIHDLLRDLCISESKNDKFFEVCTDDNIQNATKPRRLSIHCSMSRYISSSNNDHSCVRSLFHFDTDLNFTSSQWDWIFKGFKLVRVLELGGRCKKIPSNLGNFIHLRYLRISSDFLIGIPASVCTLGNLQTLDLRGYSNSFPYGMWKLKQLRHLYSNGPIMLHGLGSESDGDVMWNLQTISFIVLNRQAASLIEKGKFPKLRKLGLQISSDCKGDEVCKLLLCLQHLSHLNKLQIILKCDTKKRVCEPHKLLPSLERLSHLTALKISGLRDQDLAKSAVAFPPFITKLTLEDINLNEHWMKALGNLTKLQNLKLSEYSLSSKYVFDLVCVAGWFPQLKFFQMRCLTIECWKLANGAMPCLQNLVIDNCHLLNDLPNELWSLTALRKVQVWQPSKTMARRLSKLKMKGGCELIVNLFELN